MADAGLSSGTYFHYRAHAKSFEAFAVYSETVLNVSVVGVFLVIVVTGLVDPSGEAFWAFAMIFWKPLRPPFDLTRAGAMRRRALHDAMEQRSFGAGSGGPNLLP